ncbi:MAG TPA: DUF2955 domain-containing protein [Steroidobacteraceae bacterium]|jgi:DUF2955 family protein|nr:DUF2955 domain-containing protein [Steroidobacteraceae bacterium]
MSDAVIPDLARSHATLRFAFGVTLALVASELLQWAPTFLAPVLAGVLLVNIPIRPPIKVAVGFIAIIAASALIAMLLSTALVRSPLILFGVAAVVVFRSLYVIAEGRSPVAPLLLMICLTTIPVLALQSSAIAAAFSYALVRATCLAVLVVWISHLLWPHVRPPRPPAKVAPLPPDARLRSALLGTAILTPLMLLYLMFGIADALPVLVATTMIVVNLDFKRGRMQAVALVAGNIGGGIAALVLIVLLAMHRSLISLTLLTALMALAFGWRIAARDALAPILLVACNAALIVFTSTLLTDKGTVDLWVTRLTQFVVAGAFTVGMMTLLWPKNTSTEPRLQ